jgi:DTW domain-containing protein
LRAHTESHLPGRCKRCWVVDRFCICAEVPTLHTRTKVVIVRHQLEERKSTGTARIAQLALPNSHVVAFHDRPNQVDTALSAMFFDQTAAVLFPREQATALHNSTQIDCLVVLDGTWRQARKMTKKLPSLQRLPFVTLSNRPETVVRLRTTSLPEGRSTLEAIAEALGVLEGNEVSGRLFALHSRYVEQVFRARGNWQQKVASGVSLSAPFGQQSE